MPLQAPLPSMILRPESSDGDHTPTIASESTVSPPGAGAGAGSAGVSLTGASATGPSADGCTAPGESLLGAGTIGEQPASARPTVSASTAPLARTRRSGDSIESV